MTSQPDRQFPNPFPRRRKNRVCDSRCNRREWPLTEPSGCVAAIDEVDVDNRNVSHLTEAVVVKIVLLNDAALDGNLPVQRGSQAFDNAAFDLVDSPLRVDDKSAVDGAGDSVDLQAIV